MRQQAKIRAELSGSDKCSALGITVSATAPVLALCRQLIADGYDPGLPLEVWRGPVLCLRVRSIGEAAQLRVANHGDGFERRRGCAGECTAASPVRENAVRLSPPCRQAKTHRRGCCAMSGARHRHKGNRVEREIVRAIKRSAVMHEA